MDIKKILKSAALSRYEKEAEYLTHLGYGIIDILIMLKSL